ncbi:hypothetical protein [Bosea sp. NBC_00550]|uniref:hypothetical protein n=1 Tax=Bosea sp. NBC_00550 TaxID=2969621 RepID=UPI00222FED5B|nr:hypothetical protein [Bosea sp. NBC_00550]UZF90629.1 hypothetical protein NWE53_15945 [Bosea sp. NBC_00550]
MSERGVAFVERWIAENISSEDFLEQGVDARFDIFTRSALAAARQSGIPEGEILEEFPDLSSRMAEAVQGAADNELRRQVENDD